MIEKELLAKERKKERERLIRGRKRMNGSIMLQSALTPKNISHNL
jgi:hypothetical protein